MHVGVIQAEARFAYVRVAMRRNHDLSAGKPQSNRTAFAVTTLPTCIRLRGAVVPCQRIDIFVDIL
jgi:hypothetical protein